MLLPEGNETIWMQIMEELTLKRNYQMNACADQKVDDVN